MWGFFSFALKPLHLYASLDILFYRVFFSVITMVLINVFFRKKIMLQNWNRFKEMSIQEQKKVIWLTLGGGFFLSSNWFVYIFVMNHVSVNAASLAYLICPIVTTVLAFFMLKEMLSSWQWGAVILSFLSCMLLSFNHFQDIFYSLVTAATYAFYLVSQRKNNEIDKFLGLTIQLIFTALILLPFYPFYRNPIPTEPLFYTCMFMIVVFFTIIPLFLNLYALKGINSSAVGIMIYINPILNFVLAVFYYKEQVRDIQLVSYFLILVSIIVFNKEVLFPKKIKAIPTRSQTK